LAITILIIFLLIVGVMILMRQPQFGELSTGAELEKIKNSSNFREDRFQNINYTPDLKEGVGYFTVMRKFFFGKSKRSRPLTALPSVKTDLHKLDADKNVLVWFGHSSYFIQVDGKKILVDPVFSGNASPVTFTTKSFKGSDIYTTDDIPVIDYLFITHDHWDHLDYRTILKLKPKIKKIITGLGVAAHLERWKFDKDIIIEKDWNEEIIVDAGFIVNTAPGRHFSGRTFKRNQSLWMSFVLTTPTTKIFIGGDSGYDTHFKTIGEKFGPFDVAFLECGQYNEYWQYIHMMPEEVVQAAQDLHAKKFIPVHWAKFSLSLHAWDEPIIRVTEESKRKNLSIITPMIGEEVDFKSNNFSREWWKEIE
jgi:L-ascorbate metabolism protein UlaG (beta-lactamase superfamily)